MVVVVMMVVVVVVVGGVPALVTKTRTRTNYYTYARRTNDICEA